MNNDNVSFSEITKLEIKKPKFGLIGPTELTAFTEEEVTIRGEKLFYGMVL